jgi:nitrate/nitrite transporter NarK
MLIGLLSFFADGYNLLIVIRFVYSFATAIYGPVSMAVVLLLAMPIFTVTVKVSEQQSSESSY